MGWLKKITRPISKVLDKIIPNEIKPALPYLSAFAPYLLGPGAGGIMSNIGINNPMLQRALMTGGINIGSQLAQEGSEGEFSGLSALLAAGQGALTAPGSAETLKGMQVSGVDQAGNLVRAGNLPVDLEAANALNLSSDIGTLGKLQNVGLKGATKAAEFLTDSGEIIRDPSKWGLNKETLGAFATPVTQGTADLAMISARQALDEYNAGLEEGSEAWYDDNARRVAIRSAMEAAGHVEDDILDALASLGLKDGGRVGFDTGGDTGIMTIEVEEDKGFFDKAKESGMSLLEKIGENLRYQFDDFVYGEPATIGFSAGNYDPEILRDPKARAIIRKKYDTLSKEKQEYIEMYLDSIAYPDDEKYEDWMYSKPGKIKFPTSEKMKEHNKKFKEGGMTSVLPRGTEMDYRGGGMIPMGSKERADDVPARLSKNEFVMTADAVRAAGGGSVNRGAKRMYDLMHNLEARV